MKTQDNGLSSFRRIARHLWEKKHWTAAGEMTLRYYAKFRCRLKKKDRTIPLGGALATAKDMLKKIEAKDVDRYDFDLDRQRVQAKPRDGKSDPFSFAEWSEKYPTFDDVKRKRSLSDDLRMVLPTPETVLRCMPADRDRARSVAEIYRQPWRSNSDPRDEKAIKEACQQRHGVQ